MSDILIGLGGILVSVHFIFGKWTEDIKVMGIIGLVCSALVLCGYK